MPKKETYILVDTIKPNTKNPRTITDAKLKLLAESISRDPEFMDIKPIIVDKNMVAVAGNQRLQAIKYLGMDKIPSTWVKPFKLSEEKQKRFALVDNAPEGMAGDWDVDLLASEYEIEDLESLGFESFELDVLFEGATELADFDETESEKKIKRNLGNTKIQIKPVLYTDDVADFEKAVLMTQEINYGKALMEICRFYIDHHDTSFS
jgi:hypothetical protein